MDLLCKVGINEIQEECIGYADGWEISVTGAPGLRFVLILEIEIFMTAYCASPCTIDDDACYLREAC
jgi:hypothetical protein